MDEPVVREAGTVCLVGTRTGSIPQPIQQSIRQCVQQSHACAFRTRAYVNNHPIFGRIFWLPPPARRRFASRTPATARQAPGTDPQMLHPSATSGAAIRPSPQPPPLVIMLISFSCVQPRGVCSPSVAGLTQLMHRRLRCVVGEEEQATLSAIEKKKKKHNNLLSPTQLLTSTIDMPKQRSAIEESSVELCWAVQILLSVSTASQQDPSWRQHPASSPRHRDSAWFTIINEKNTNVAPIQYSALEYRFCITICPINDSGIVRLSPTVTINGVVRSIAYAHATSDTSDTPALICSC